MRIAVIGDGGHGKVVRDLIGLRPELRLTAVLDDRYRFGRMADDVFRGPVSACSDLAEQDPELHFVLAIGDNRVRSDIARRLESCTANFATVIHPAAVVSPSARIGAGSVVMARAVVQAGAAVGGHAIVNTGAIVEHDCRIGAYAHVCPGATLTGGVTAGEGAMIGAGAVVIPGRAIGEWAVVGAGAVVTRAIPPYAVAAGVPAAVKRFAAPPADEDNGKGNAS